MLKRRLLPLALLISLLGAFVLAPIGTAAQRPTNFAYPVSNITGSTANGGAFNGVFTITQIVNQNGVLSAVGTLTGTLTDALGNVIGMVTNAPITIPITSTTGSSCQVLHLELGPLDLDLLGLQVHLDKVVLDITAQPGSGNLLGNLLCAVAHLLDSNASGNAIANLLNQILGLLG